MKKEKLLIFLLIFLTFVLRLYRLDGPVADWHSWRQADTAAVARNFLRFGFDPLRPRFDDLSNVPSGKDNPQGYRMVELPIYQSLGFGLYHLLKFLPGITIEISLRLISITSSLGIMVILYQMAKKDLGILTALGTLLLIGFLPYSLFFSRAILPEMLAVFWALAAIFIYDRLRGSGGRIVSGLFAGLTLLTKPTAGFLLLPLLYFWLRDFKFTRHFFFCFFLFGFLSLGGFLFWRQWIQQFPEGIPANLWLLNQDNIRFSGAFFRWLLAERLAKLIFGYWLVIPFAVGVMTKIHRQSLTYLFLLAGTVLYALVFARGNVQHDYYQILWLPALAIFSGLGMAFLLTKREGLNRFLATGLSIFCLLAGFAFSWYEIKTFYWINNPAIVEAGKAVDRLVPKEAKVIAPYGGDTAFLYQTGRQGWPVGFEIEKKIQMGADYYVNVNVNDPETQFVIKKWTPIVVNERYVIVKLQ